MEQHHCLAALRAEQCNTNQIIGARADNAVVPIAVRLQGAAHNNRLRSAHKPRRSVSPDVSQLLRAGEGGKGGMWREVKQRLTSSSSSSAIAKSSMSGTSSMSGMSSFSPLLPPAACTSPTGLSSETASILRFRVSNPGPAQWPSFTQMHLHRHTETHARTCTRARKTRGSRIAFAVGRRITLRLRW